MSDPVIPAQPWGCMQWGAVIVVGSLALFFPLPILDMRADMASQTVVANNARQIIIAMKIYANDHDGEYPDSKHPEIATANQAFRVLFQEDIIQDERIFGSKFSRWIPDGQIGHAPEFKEAIKAGENHWAWVAKQSTKSPGHHPVIFENSLDSSWPPKWKPDAAETPVRGRTWKGGKIIVGRNDNSVIVEQLKKDRDFLSLSETSLKGVPSDLKVLDIEER